MNNSELIDQCSDDDIILEQSLFKDFADQLEALKNELSLKVLNKIEELECHLDDYDGQCIEV